MFHTDHFEERRIHWLKYNTFSSEKFYSLDSKQNKQNKQEHFAFAS